MVRHASESGVVAESGEQSASRASAPSTRTRVAIAVAIGGFAAAISWLATHRPGFGIPDFHSWWLAARALVDGLDPYAVVPQEVGFGFFYPLPAAVLTIPLAYVRPDIALALFSAVSTALLAWAVTRDSYDRLPLFLSASFAHAAVMGQWSLLLTAAILIPRLGITAAAKPNLGLALLGYTLSWRLALAIIAFTGLTIVLSPEWPARWIASLRASEFHPAPLQLAGGFLVLLALLRWRRPEARLLAVMGVVPQSPFVYEALPLFVVPRSRLETYVLVIGSDLAFGAYALARGAERASFFRLTGIAVVLGMYFPALIMVLRRPNEGTAPAWLERASDVLPRWLRGISTATSPKG